MSELLTITVEARTAEEAAEQARKWAQTEPNIRLLRITRVRPATGNAPNPERWSVEIAFIADAQMDAGL